MTDAPANTPSPRFSRPRPAIRKTAKWGGLILSIFLVAAWVASVWLDFGYVSDAGFAVSAEDNRLLLYWQRDTSTASELGYGWLRAHSPTLRWPLVIRTLPTVWFTYIPFWAITLPTIAVTVFAWRRDAAARRRALHNHCPACGYDRAGLSTPAALCPECGAAAPTAASAT